jgi:hypothetical protein
MSEHVKAELTDGILVLTLQRPEKKNALTGAMYDALSDNLERAETDSATIWPTLPRKPTAGTARKARRSASSQISARQQNR